MNRIIVVGVSGSGKTTVARVLAEKLDLPLLELDGVYHQRDWEPMGREEFRATLADFALQPSWVIDGNYRSEGMRELVWPVADTMVWLDLPRSVVMRRIVVRTLRRWVTREKLWNGNREPIAGPFRLDPEKSIIRWAWTSYDGLREGYSRALEEPDTAHLRVVRLRSTREVATFIAAVS